MEAVKFSYKHAIKGLLLHVHFTYKGFTNSHIQISFCV